MSCNTDRKIWTTDSDYLLIRDGYIWSEYNDCKPLRSKFLKNIELFAFIVLIVLARPFVSRPAFSVNPTKLNQQYQSTEGDATKEKENNENN